MALLNKAFWIFWNASFIPDFIGIQYRCNYYNIVHWSHKLTEIMKFINFIITISAHNILTPKLST